LKWTSPRRERSGGVGDLGDVSKALLIGPLSERLDKSCSGFGSHGIRAASHANPGID
jgi:hypothetical protein